MKILLKYFDDFSQEQLKQFAALEELYNDWNEKINVISRKDIGSLYEKHILHSLAIAAVFNLEAGMKIVDIGTGGGFPGIPLAIYFPKVEFLLVDSIGKKIKVVNEISKALGLENIRTHHGRIEELASPQFDFAVSRAVTSLKQLWKWSKPILRKERNLKDFRNGLICLKGGDLGLEISESRLKPHCWYIQSLFKEDFFSDKYLLYVPL
jgi:16S rRNA (guanine527-N7)-methyltransferase